MPCQTNSFAMPSADHVVLNGSFNKSLDKQGGAQVRFCEWHVNKLKHD